MTTYNRQYSSIPLPGDVTVRNYAAAGTSNDIAAFSVVVIDTTAGNQVPLQDGYPIALPATGGNPGVGIGVLMETAVASGNGARMRPLGPIVPVVCDGAVTTGTVVDVSVTTAGRVKAHTSGKQSFGIALMTGADGDTIEIMLCSDAPNA